MRLRRLLPYARLGEFLRDNDINPSDLAEMVGMSPEDHLVGFRYGSREPPLSLMIQLTKGCRRLLNRHVRITELFDLGDGER